MRAEVERARAGDGEKYQRGGNENLPELAAREGTSATLTSSLTLEPAQARNRMLAMAFGRSRTPLSCAFGTLRKSQPGSSRFCIALQPLAIRNAFRRRADNADRGPSPAHG